MPAAPRIGNRFPVRSATIFSVFTIFILELMFALPVLSAAEKSLWQIGKTDHSPLEFNSTWDFSQGHDPNFAVGTSQPDKDWSAFHPGTADAASGHRSHPFRVGFQLESPPRGNFYLTVDVIVKIPLEPVLFIDVNGKKGAFYFHPTLTYDIGDAVAGMDLTFSVQRLRVPLPAEYFHKGANSLVLTAADDRSRVILPQAKLADGQTSGFWYDALQLSQDAEAKPGKPPLRISAEPTVFYRQHTGDGLHEVVLLEMSTAGAAQKANASLQIGKNRYGCVLPAGFDFGESECAVEIPELAGSTPARVAVNWGKQAGWAQVQLAPAKKWKLFLCPHEHMDPGYNDYRDNIAETHNRTIDGIVATMESHPDFRYGIDHSYVLGDYWDHRGEEWRARCLKVLREQRLTLPAFPFSINDGLASQEELARAAYLSGTFGRQYQVPMVYTDQTDVPAHSWSLPSVLHSIGVKYLAIGSNSYRGAIIIHGRLNEKSPFWWEGPDGGKVLTWFSRMYDQREFLFASRFNGSPNLSAGVNSVPIFLQTFRSPSYEADAAMLYGSQGDMRPFDAEEEVSFPELWNQQFAYPKIVISTMPEFFAYMEKNFASSFTTLRGDGGAWWDEMAAANAAVTAVYRQARERARAADTAISLGSIVNQGLRPPIEQEREIWRNLLWYPEHTWGSARAWFNPDTDLATELHNDKDAFVWRADQESRHMLHRGLSQLTEQIFTQADTIVVFNPLSWARGGLVEMDLERGHGLIDLATDRPVSLELLQRTRAEETTAVTDEFDGALDRVRFWVDSVPALGYHAYKITATGGAVSASDVPISNSFENEFYKVTVDPARSGITSVFDKQLGKELVNGADPHAMDQYVYAGYGHEASSLIEQRTRFNSSLLVFGRDLPRPDLQVTSAQAGKIVAIRKVPWGTILVWRSSAIHTPVIETEVRLFDQQKAIELVNTVQKDVVKAPEGVYFAFPFSGQRPVVRYEIQNAWVDPEHDQLPGANKEWFAGQHWISVSNPEFSTALAIKEAPLFTIGDINRGVWPTELNPHLGTVFSYIMDNYDGDDEKPYQGGTFTFHYALSSASAFAPANLARFGREQAAPLEIDRVDAVDRYGYPPRPLRAPTAGFIQIDASEVVLSVLKPADDGKGHVLRFYNTTDKPVVARVRFPGLEFDSAESVDPLESKGSPIGTRGGQLELAMGPHAISALRVIGFRLAAAELAKEQGKP